MNDAQHVNTLKSITEELNQEFATSSNPINKFSVWCQMVKGIIMLVLVLALGITQWNYESNRVLRLESDKQLQLESDRQLELTCAISTYFDAVDVTTESYVNHIKPCTGDANLQDTTNYVANNETVKKAWADMLSARQTLPQCGNFPIGNTLIEDVANHVRNWCSNNVGRADGSGQSQLGDKGKF